MLTEHALVDGVHPVELTYVNEEHAAPQHVLQPGAGGVEDRLHVLQALLGLHFDIGAGDLSGGRIHGALTGYEHETIELHGRRVRSPWFRQLVADHRSMCAHDAPQ